MSMIHTIHLSRLHNAEYVQMGEDTKAITDELAASAPEISPFAAAFNDRIAAINAVFITDPASPLTKSIEAADARRDDAIVGLSFIARGMSYSTDAAQKAAGEALYHSITLYSDSIAGQSYVAESASLTNLLADFSSKPELSNAIGTLGLGGWREELKAANEDFKAKYQQRTDAYGDASPDTVRSLRVTADAAFKKLREKVEAYYSIHDGAAPWSTLVSRLNAMTDQYNTLIATHTGPKKTDDPA